MGEKKKPRVNMTMRLRVLTALFLVIGFGLVGVRLLYMQVFHHDFYIQKATSLQTRDTFITPNRGKIYDANMQVLAESAEVERITVSPKAVVSETKEKNGVTADVQRQTLATILSETLSVSYDSVMEKLNKTDSEYEIIAQKVDKDVTKELNAKLEAAGCTGVYSEPDTKRYYQHGSFLSAVLGYVGSDNNGAYGIESQYNDELSGTAGRIVRVQNAQNEDIVPDTQQYIPAKDGNSLVLTIDSDIQNYLEKHLETAFADNPEARDGVSGIVMNIKTGEVLAMASYPTYSLADYNSTAAAEDRANDSRHPEVNRVTSGVYPPGSTFKVLSAIAGLEEGIIDANTQITCTGVFEYGGQKFTCNNHDTPMTLDVTGALKYSCNTFFYTVGQKLTGEHLEKWSERFGLGVVTGIGIGERSGHAAGPTYRAEMKKADPSTRGWQGGDDVIAAIGQSDNGFTPLQLADYISAVVNGGTLYQPTLVRNIKSYDFSNVVKSETPNVKEKIEISDETRRLVMQGMSEVTDEGGTAGSVFADYPIKVGGKTGTAETYENGEAFDNGLFIAFAPFDDPQIVICVVGEGAGHGAYVAPVVRDMLDEFFTADDVENVDAVPTENTLLR